MDKLRAVHVSMEGFSTFFRHPLAITGTQITLPCPPYSTILGLASACAGRVITPNDTRIGYEFRCVSTDVELERTDRFVIDKKGYLTQHREGQGILKRYVHFRPRLDLYFTDLDLAFAFKNPVSPPSLGRSQDLFWVSKVQEVDLFPLELGNLGPTMILSTNIKSQLPSLIVRCPEWFYNDTKGMTRIVGPVGFYQVLSPTSECRFKVKMDNLYHPSNLQNTDDVIYLHKWISES